MNNEYPILFFPTRDETLRTRRFTPQTSYVTYPESHRQIQRLTPKFDALQNTLEHMRMQLHDIPDAQNPEKVLVIEVVGSVSNFINAAVRVEGLEWMGEIDVDGIQGDEYFYDRRQGHDLISGKLYLVSTNSRALEEVISLWRLYKHDPNVVFRRGFTPFKHLFAHLKDIHPWGIQERFHETGMIDVWRENLEINPDRSVRFEVELWYRENPVVRDNAFAKVSQLITSLGGSVISQSVIPEIRYHAVLGELPANQVESILLNQDVELLKCDGVMFFRPSGQMLVKHELEENDVDVLEVEQNEIPADDEPVVAVFDGLPVENHTCLSNRLLVNDVDQIAERCEAKYRVHGTSMCSLILKGDLSANEEYAAHPLYVRPVMEPNVHDRNLVECVPDNLLIVDLIHRAVKEIFDTHNGQPPAAPTIKIINMSIGLKDRMFYYSMSPLARLLDWLSFKYNVLFVVSAGNVDTIIKGNCNTMNAFKALSRTEQKKYIVEGVLNNRRNSRLLSPAESINSISVGSVHYDGSILANPDDRVNPYDEILPSTYSPFGGGYRKSIKPDMVFDGGREMLRGDVLGNLPLTGKNFPKKTPGLYCASPGSVTDKSYYVGTSCSTALISRNASFIYDLIKGLDNNHSIDDKYISVLIKAMLAHGCSWDALGDNINQLVPQNYAGLDLKNLKRQWIGYGYPNFDMLFNGSPRKVTAIGFGELMQGSAHIFTLPLPPSLAANPVRKRLTITLAYFAPIAPSTQKYRHSRVWFEEVGTRPLSVSRVDVADQHAPKRGTLQHEIFEGEAADVFAEGAAIKIKVNCAEDAVMDSSVPVLYSLVVSLEVAEGIDLPIYQEVRDRLKIPVLVDNAE